MQRHRCYRKPVFLSEFPNLYQIHQVLDIFLYLFKTDQRIELIHQFIKIRLLRLFFRGSRIRRCSSSGGLRAAFSHEARIAAGNIVKRVERLFAFLNSRGIADSSELVDTFGYIFRLGICHIIVSGGKIHKDISQHADKRA